LGASTPTRQEVPAALEWLAAAAAALLLAWQLVSPDPRIGDDDFQVFYGGAAAIAAGHSPYVGDFVSPPWFALALVPLTLLPSETARGVWLASNLALLLVTTVACARLLAFAWPPRRLLLAALLFGLWPPVEFGLRLGQNSLLVWTLVLAALLAARSGHAGVVGALLALGLIKPQLVVLYLVGLGIWAARRRALLPFSAAALAVLLTLAVLVGVAAPETYVDLLAHRPHTWNYWGSTVALPPLLAVLTCSPLIGVVLYLPAALTGSLALARAWLRDAPQDLAYLAALTASATLLLTPYAYPYDAVLLQLSILWLLGAARTRLPQSTDRAPGQPPGSAGVSPARPSSPPPAQPPRWPRSSPGSAGVSPARPVQPTPEKRPSRLRCLATAGSALAGDRRLALVGLALAIVAIWLLERPADYTAWRLLGLLPPLGLLVALRLARRALS
jgi:hypothetical protein